MAAPASDLRPRWLRDLLRFIPLKSQFVLSGSVRDLQAHEVSAGTVAAVPLRLVLVSQLVVVGYARVLAYDPVSDFASRIRVERLPSTTPFCKALDSPLPMAPPLQVRTFSAPYSSESCRVRGRPLPSSLTLLRAC